MNDNEAKSAIASALSKFIVTIDGEEVSYRKAPNGDYIVEQSFARYAPNVVVKYGFDRENLAVSAGTYSLGVGDTLRVTIPKQIVNDISKQWTASLSKE